MRRLSVDADKTHGRQVSVHPHILDGAGVLEFILDIANRHRDLAGSHRLN